MEKIILLVQIDQKSFYGCVNNVVQIVQQSGLICREKSRSGPKSGNLYQSGGNGDGFWWSPKICLV